jgi:hypothetical protein
MRYAFPGEARGGAHLPHNTHRKRPYLPGDPGPLGALQSASARSGRIALGTVREPWEERMSGDEQRVVDALRMLRAAVDAEMADKQLESEEDVIGVPTPMPRGT